LCQIFYRQAFYQEVVVSIGMSLRYALIIGGIVFALIIAGLLYPGPPVDFGRSVDNQTSSEHIVIIHMPPPVKTVWLTSNDTLDH